MATYLISENYIKENSPVTANLNMKDLFPHIRAAQELFLQNIMGSQFYDDILEKYENQTLTPDETVLVSDFIKPAVLWRTIDLALPWLQLNLRAKGVLVNTDDNANPASTFDLKYLKNEASNRAEFHENLLVKYLCKNTSTFPLYNTQDGLTKPDKGTQFRNGIIFY